MVCRRRPCWHGNQLLGEKNLSDKVKHQTKAALAICLNALFLSAGQIYGRVTGELIHVCLWELPAVRAKDVWRFVIWSDPTSSSSVQEDLKES